MKPSDFLPPMQVFTGLLITRLKAALNLSGAYHAERATAQGGGAHTLIVRDTEDGQLYRLTVEPESVALEREDREQRAADAVKARIAARRAERRGRS